MNNSNEITSNVKYQLLTRALKEINVLKIKIVGKSMLPYFKDGEYVNIEKIVHNKISKNDKVLYFNKGMKLVFHKVVAIKDESILTNGYNENEIDTIPQINVIGKLSNKAFEKNIDATIYINENSSKSLIIKNSTIIGFITRNESSK